MTARPPATASGWRPRSRAGRPASGGSGGRSRSPRRTSLVGRSGTRSCGTGGVSTCCARPPLRYGPAGDTPPAPRLGWQLWALRPGLDGGVPADHDAHGDAADRRTRGHQGTVLLKADHRHRDARPLPGPVTPTFGAGARRVPRRAPVQADSRYTTIGTGKNGCRQPAKVVDAEHAVVHRHEPSVQSLNQLPQPTAPIPIRQPGQQPHRRRGPQAAAARRRPAGAVTEPADQYPIHAPTPPDQGANRRRDAAAGPDRRRGDRDPKRSTPARAEPRSASPRRPAPRPNRTPSSPVKPTPAIKTRAVDTPKSTAEGGADRSKPISPLDPKSTTDGAGTDRNRSP